MGILDNIKEAADARMRDWAGDLLGEILEHKILHVSLMYKGAQYNFQIIGNRTKSNDRQLPLEPMVTAYLTDAPKEEPPK